MTNQFLDERFLADRRRRRLAQQPRPRCGSSSTAANIACVTARRFEARFKIAHASASTRQVSEQIMPAYIPLVHS